MAGSAYKGADERPWIAVDWSGLDMFGAVAGRSNVHFVIDTGATLSALDDQNAYVRFYGGAQPQTVIGIGGAVQLMLIGPVDLSFEVLDPSSGRSRVRTYNAPVLRTTNTGGANLLGVDVLCGGAGAPLLCLTFDNRTQSPRVALEE